MAKSEIENTIDSNAIGVVVQCPCSALMVAAVKAFHREELRWIEPEQVFRTPGNPCLRIWTWASKRWGIRWQRLEFDMRNKPNVPALAPCESATPKTH